MSNLFALLGILLLSGCSSLGPQSVVIDPTLDIQAEAARDRRVTVIIQDRRPLEIIGSRDSANPDNSLIRLSRPLSSSLLSSARLALQELGYTPVSRGGDVSLTLFIEELSYKPSLDTIIKVSIIARAENLYQLRESRFNTEQRHHTLRPPSKDMNQRIINDALAETLNRLFNDQKILTIFDQ